MSVSAVVGQGCAVREVPNNIALHKLSHFGSYLGAYSIKVRMESNAQSLFAITMSSGTYRVCIAEPKGSQEALQECLRQRKHVHATWELLFAHGDTRHELLAAGTVIEWNGRQYFPCLTGKVLTLMEVNDAVWGNKFLLTPNKS